MVLVTVLQCPPYYSIWMDAEHSSRYSQLIGTVWKEDTAQDFFSRKLYFNRKQNWRRNGVLGGVALAFLGGEN